VTAQSKQSSAEQQTISQFRALAAPYRFRMQADSEGFPVIPGQYGQIESLDGRDLAVYTNRPRLFAKLGAIPGMRRHQTGTQIRRCSGSKRWMKSSKPSGPGAGAPCGPRKPGDDA
jgi:hypothetical protein